MSPRRTSVAGLLAWIVVLNGVAAIGAEPARGEPAQELPFSKLQVSVRTSGTEFLQGEPIAVWVEIANPHHAPIRAHRRYRSWRPAGIALDGGYNYMPLMLSRAGGSRDGERTEKYWPGPEKSSLPHPAPPLLALIEPGERLRTKELVTGPSERFGSLAPPGTTIRITAQFRDIVGREPAVVVSGPVAVRIVDPQGRDAEAYAWLSKRGLPRLLGYIHAARWAIEDKNVTNLDEFLKQFGETRYAPYAAFALGQLHFDRGRYRQAIGVLERLVEQHPKATVAEDALYLVAESHYRLKLPFEAERRFRELARRYPDTAAADDARATLEAIAPILFHEDSRLDREITLELPEAGPLAGAVREISRVAGVPLRVAPEFESRPFMGSAKRPRTLRSLLTSVGAGVRWDREEDGGYRLVRIRPGEFANLNDPNAAKELKVAETARQALLELMRKHPAWFQGLPAIDQMEQSSLAWFEGGHPRLFGWNAITIDLDRRCYRAIISGKNRVQSCRGTFVVSVSGEWTAEKPRIRELDPSTGLERE